MNESTELIRSLVSLEVIYNMVRFEGIPWVDEGEVKANPDGDSAALLGKCRGDRRHARYAGMSYFSLFIQHIFFKLTGYKLSQHVSG